MSRWGNAKPRDTESPVAIFNKGAAAEMLHNGETVLIPSGLSILAAHLAERAVRKLPDVIFGTVASDVAEPEPVAEPAPEPVVESSSDSVVPEPEPVEPAEPVIPEVPAVKPELAEPAEVNE